MLSLIPMTICEQVFPQCFIDDEVSLGTERNVPSMTWLLTTETQLSPGMCAQDEESNSGGKAASAVYDCGVRKLASSNSHAASIPDMEWDDSVMATWSRL